MTKLDKENQKLRLDAQVLGVLETQDCPIMGIQVILRRLYPSIYVNDSHHPEYRRVLRSLDRLIEHNIADKLTTTQNENIYWLCSRVTYLTETIPF